MLNEGYKILVFLLKIIALFVKNTNTNFYENLFYYNMKLSLLIYELKYQIILRKSIRLAGYIDNAKYSETKLTFLESLIFFT